MKITDVTDITVVTDYIENDIGRIMVGCAVCGVLFFVCVHVVLCRRVGCVCVCVWCGGACVWCVVKLGTREKAPCVD